MICEVGMEKCDVYASFQKFVPMQIITKDMSVYVYEFQSTSVRKYQAHQPKQIEIIQRLQRTAFGLYS